MIYGGIKGKSKPVSLLRRDLLQKNSIQVRGLSERTLYHNFKLDSQSVKASNRLKLNQRADWETPELLRTLTEDTPEATVINKNSQTSPLELAKTLSSTSIKERVRTLSVPQIHFEGLVLPRTCKLSGSSQSTRGHLGFENYRFRKMNAKPSYKLSTQKFHNDELPFSCKGYHFQNSRAETKLVPLSTKQTEEVEVKHRRAASTSTDQIPPDQRVEFQVPKSPPFPESSVFCPPQSFNFNKLFSLRVLAPHRISVEHNLFLKRKSALNKRKRQGVVKSNKYQL
mmetsp:Transcript_18471/g.33260  ORF Transcript_18471/g.33260 Transcript_18471/m.33260 type:complete len:283 (+) Transcript_18471:40-888(+)